MPDDSAPPSPAVTDDLASLLGCPAVREEKGRVPAWRIPASAVPEACQRLKAAGYDYLLFLTALDYPKENRFEVTYLISNFSDAREVCLVADIPREAPHIATVSQVWEAADWHEREVFDLFGIHFDGHPDLRRILLDDSWTGHPLRKDYTDPVHEMIKRPY